MGHEQRGDLETGLQDADLLAQLHADLGIEGGQGLVEQEHARLNGQGAGQGHPLLLAAGHLVRVLGRLGGQPHQLELLQGPGASLLAPDLAHAQAEGHVVQRRHVREEAVALEDHAHVALLGGNAGLVDAVDQDAPRVDRLEAGQDPQGGGLPAPGRSEKGDQLTRFEGQGEPVERLGGPEAAAQAQQTPPRLRCARSPGTARSLGRAAPRSWSYQASFRSWAMRRMRRRSNEEITISTAHVTTSASSETAVDTCPSSWANW